MTKKCKTHTLVVLCSEKLIFSFNSMPNIRDHFMSLLQHKLQIRCMRNQNFETDIAYKSAKCNNLRQYGAVTGLLQFIHNQRGVLFVAQKAITVRTSKISLCLPHIRLMYSPFSLTVPVTLT